MKRAAMVGWCVLTTAAWLLVAMGISRFTYAHVSFEIPIGFRRLVAWIWHFCDPGYEPDALDVEDAADLTLVAVSLLLAAVVVVPIGVFGWRRIAHSRRGW